VHIPPKKKRSYMQLSEPLAIRGDYSLIVAVESPRAQKHRVLWPNPNAIATEFNMRLREFSQTDFVTVNTELNPKLWQEGRLDGKVRLKLLQIARAFVDFVGVDLDIKDYTITGSNANYTWSKYSDLDQTHKENCFQRKRHCGQNTMISQ
jgi:hypothetical protein